MDGAATTTMSNLATFLADVTTSVTSLQELVEGWLTFVIGQPALFLMIIAVPLVGKAIGWVQGLFRLN